MPKSRAGRAGSEDRSAGKTGRRTGHPADGLGGPSCAVRRMRTIPCRGWPTGRSCRPTCSRRSIRSMQGKFKRRTPGGRSEGVRYGGGTPQSEEAVERAAPLARGPSAPGRQLELQPSERRLPALLHPSRQRGQHHGRHRLGPAALPRRGLHAQGGRVPGRRRSAGWIT